MSTVNSMFLSSGSVMNHLSSTGLLAQDNCNSAEGKEPKPCRSEAIPIYNRQQSEHTGHRREIPIHRLSAVGLLRSLRAGDRGPTIEMAEDSSNNAFSFAGHAAAPAAGTQSNSSQSIDTGGSDNSELRTQVPRRALVAPRGRQLPTIPVIEDADSTPENEDHLHDNRRLRWLQGQRRSLHPRIRLRRFRTRHHRESDHTRR